MDLETLVMDEYIYIPLLLIGSVAAFDLGLLIGWIMLHV